MLLKRIGQGLILAVFACLLISCAQTEQTTHTTESTKNEKQEEAARIHTELGQKYMQQGKLELALEKLNTALSYDASYVDAHTVIAVLYENIGNYNKAEEHYRRAAQLKSKGGAELNNYGAFLCKTGKYDDAKKYFDRAIADPFYKTPDVALTNAGTCYLKAGKLEAAEKNLREAVDRGPQNAEALYSLSDVLYQTGDYFHARAFIQRFESVSKDPRPEALALGRNIELKLGNASGAHDYARRLREKFPDSEQARALSAANPS